MVRVVLLSLFLVLLCASLCVAVSARLSWSFCYVASSAPLSFSTGSSLFGPWSVSIAGELVTESSPSSAYSVSGQAGYAVVSANLTRSSFIRSASRSSSQQLSLAPVNSYWPNSSTAGIALGNDNVLLPSAPFLSSTGIALASVTGALMTLPNGFPVGVTELYAASSAAQQDLLAVFEFFSEPAGSSSLTVRLLTGSQNASAPHCPTAASAFNSSEEEAEVQWSFCYLVVSNASSQLVSGLLSTTARYVEQSSPALPLPVTVYKLLSASGSRTVVNASSSRSSAIVGIGFSFPLSPGLEAPDNGAYNVLTAGGALTQYGVDLVFADADIAVFAGANGGQLQQAGTEAEQPLDEQQVLFSLWNASTAVTASCEPPAASSTAGSSAPPPPPLASLLTFPPVLYNSTVFHTSGFTFVEWEPCPATGLLTALRLRWWGLSASPYAALNLTDLSIGVGLYDNESAVYLPDSSRARSLLVPAPASLPLYAAWDIALSSNDSVLCLQGEQLAIYARYTQLGYYGSETGPVQFPLIYAEEDCTGALGAGNCTMKPAFDWYGLSAQFTLQLSQQSSSGSSAAAAAATASSASTASAGSASSWLPSCASAGPSLTSSVATWSFASSSPSSASGSSPASSGSSSLSSISSSSAASLSSPAVSALTASSTTSPAPSSPPAVSSSASSAVSQQLSSAPFATSAASQQQSSSSSSLPARFVATSASSSLSSPPVPRSSTGLSAASSGGSSASANSNSVSSPSSPPTSPSSPSSLPIASSAAPSSSATLSSSSRMTASSSSSGSNVAFLSSFTSSVSRASLSSSSISARPVSSVSSVASSTPSSASTAATGAASSSSAAASSVRSAPSVATAPSSSAFFSSVPRSTASGSSTSSPSSSSASSSAFSASSASASSASSAPFESSSSSAVYVPVVDAGGCFSTAGIAPSSLLLSFRLNASMDSLPASFAATLLQAIGSDLGIPIAFLLCVDVELQPPLANDSFAPVDPWRACFVSVALLSTLPSSVSLLSTAQLLNSDIQSGALQRLLPAAFPIPTAQSLSIAQVCGEDDYVAVDAQCSGLQQQQSGASSSSSSSLSRDAIIGIAVGVGGALLLCLLLLLLLLPVWRRREAKRQHAQQYADREAQRLPGAWPRDAADTETGTASPRSPSSMRPV